MCKYSQMCGGKNPEYIKIALSCMKHIPIMSPFKVLYTHSKFWLKHQMFLWNILLLKIF